MAAVLQSRPVGSLACQKDSYLRTLDAEVVSCTKLPQPLEKSRVSKKKSETAKDESSTKSHDLWRIEFSDSVLFPEGTSRAQTKAFGASNEIDHRAGGGQPGDHGSLQPLPSGKDEPSDAIPINSVQRDGLRSVCHSSQPLEPGLKVRQNVDSARRWDHMQQHTGQHLLSAVMDTYDNLETVGWAMGQVGSSNYVDLPRTPSKGELRSIENRCNEIIRDSIGIEVLYPEGNGVSEGNGEDKHEKGVIRVIKMGDIDSNPCCGTHLSQTSHIQMILLQSTQAVRRTDCRLYFVAGERALSVASSSAEGIRTIAYDLTCGTSAKDVVAAVDKVKADRAELRRKEVKLLKEIAKFEGERLSAEVKAGRNAYVHRGLEGMEFVNMVLFELKQTLKETKDVVAVLAIGEEKKAGQLVVTGPSGAVEAFANRLLEGDIDVKGNGKGERWQGKVVEWKKGDLKKLEALVKESAKES